MYVLEQPHGLVVLRLHLAVEVLNALLMYIYIYTHTYIYVYVYRIYIYIYIYIYIIIYIYTYLSLSHSPSLYIYIYIHIYTCISYIYIYIHICAPSRRRGCPVPGRADSQKADRPGACGGAVTCILLHYHYGILYYTILYYTILYYSIWWLVIIHLHLCWHSYPRPCPRLFAEQFWLRSKRAQLEVRRTSRAGAWVWIWISQLHGDAIPSMAMGYGYSIV